MPIREPDRADLVALDRTTLRVWGWGDPTDPLVLCLHGAYDHGRMFDEIAPRVAALGYHAVAVDLRGHGDSGPLDTGFAWTLLHLDLALLIRHLGGGPVGFVAHSFGGGQATGVAGAFPELVRWIVNIDGLGPPQAALVPPDQIPDAIRQSFDRTDRALLGQRRPWASIEAMAEYRGRNNHRLPPEWALHLARHGARQVEGGWVWKADPMFGIGIPSEFNVAMLEAELRHTTCPVLVLTGDQEDTWRELTAQEAADRVRWLGARHEVVPGTGHYVHIEDPDAVMAHLEAFVAEVGTVTEVVLLHDLGVEEAGGPWRAVAPEGWHIPDLPGHGTTAAPRHGAYDPMGPVTLARWALRGHGCVVGVGQNAHAALILAAGGGCDAVAIVDGLWGPWQEPDDAIDDMYANLRAILADDAAIGPPPPSGLDPRAKHGYGVNVSPAFAQRFWGSVACPVLVIETPASSTPTAERAERVSWFGGRVDVVEMETGDVQAIVAAVVAW